MPKIRPTSLALLSVVFLASHCRTPSGDGPKPSEPAASEVQASKKPLLPPPVAPSAPLAAVGREAPDFTLPDLDGRAVHLKDFRGKVVVLEWFNPECPFVRASHTKGSLVGAAAKHMAEGVVWLGVNSAAPGKQGAGAERSREGKSRLGVPNPILLDESGAVGKLYGAQRTPHLYVIDPRGVLVYRGAVDNSPDGEGESPTGGTLVRYVDAALTALRAGKPVAVAETEAYGCGVKYGHYGK